MVALRNQRPALLGALFAALLAVTTACSRPETPTTPTATVGAAPTPRVTNDPSEEPTHPPDPYAIPANPEDIDEAYVEGVLNALTASVPFAVRTGARTGRLNREAKHHLAAAYRERGRSSVVAQLQTALRDPVSRAALDPNATDPAIRVKKLLFASERCVFVLVRQDTSGLVRAPIKPFLAYYHLDSKGPDEDPLGLNPTPWMIVADAEPAGRGKEYVNPCLRAG